LPDALEKMLDGQVQRSDETIALTENLEQVGRAFTRDPQGRNRDKGLTPREREVIRLLAEGKSMKEAADILGVTASAIAYHKHRMMEHLGTKTTAELIQVGVTKCLISRLTGEIPV
jgi:DNA-binding CsgD family transcriptional regulator